MLINCFLAISSNYFRYCTNLFLAHAIGFFIRYFCTGIELILHSFFNALREVRKQSFYILEHEYISISGKAPNQSNIWRKNKFI